MIKLRHMESDDKRFFVASIVIPIGVWWYFTGRKKYGTKGMK
jgi:hypothetical protein